MITLRLDDIHIYGIIYQIHHILHIHVLIQKIDSKSGLKRGRKIHLMHGLNLGLNQIRMHDLSLGRELTLMRSQQMTLNLDQKLTQMPDLILCLNLMIWIP